MPGACVAAGPDDGAEAEVAGVERAGGSAVGWSQHRTVVWYVMTPYYACISCVRVAGAATAG